MKSFVQFMIPFYPVQINPKDEDGEWVTGDPPIPIQQHKKASWKVTLAKSDKQVTKDRHTLGSVVKNNKNFHRENA